MSGLRSLGIRFMPGDRYRFPRWFTAGGHRTRRLVMENATFDALVQRLGMNRSRRRVLGGVVAAVTGLTGAAIFSESDANAGDRRRRRQRRTNRDKVCHSGDTREVRKRAVNRH